MRALDERRETSPPVAVEGGDGGAVLEVVEDLPGGVGVLQRAPLHEELLRQRASAPQRVLRQQRGVAAQRRGKIFLRQTRRQHAIDLRELGVEETLAAVGGELREKLVLLAVEALRLSGGKRLPAASGGCASPRRPSGPTRSPRCSGDRRGRAT